MARTRAATPGRAQAVAENGTSGRAARQLGCARSAVLPGLLRELHRELPKVEIRLTESADDFELLTLVEQGALDLCFVALPIRPGRSRSRSCCGIPTS